MFILGAQSLDIERTISFRLRILMKKSKNEATQYLEFDPNQAGKAHIQCTVETGLKNSPSSSGFDRRQSLIKLGCSYQDRNAIIRTVHKLSCFPFWTAIIRMGVSLSEFRNAELPAAGFFTGSGRLLLFCKTCYFTETQGNLSFVCIQEVTST